MSFGVIASIEENLFLQPLQHNATVSPLEFFTVMSGSALLSGLIGHISFKVSGFIETICACFTVGGSAAKNLFLHPLQQNATVSPFSFLAVIPGLASFVVLIGHFSFMGTDGLAAISMFIFRAAFLELYLCITSSKISSALI